MVGYVQVGDPISSVNKERQNANSIYMFFSYHAVRLPAHDIMKQNTYRSATTAGTLGLTTSRRCDASSSRWQSP